MRRASAYVLIASAAAVLLHPAAAQPAGDHLTDIQRTGRQIFAQSCGLCHLPPAINARTFGPVLSQATASGNDEVIRGVISDGTPRMPGFKYYLERPQIDAIIAYLKTVPEPAPTPAPAAQTR